MKKQVKVMWVEETEYEHTFELDIEGELPEDDELHELMDSQGAWDQLTEKDWLGGALNYVKERTIEQAQVMGTSSDDHFDDGSASLAEAQQYRPPSDEALTSGSAWNQHVRENERDEP